jgi:hypothetical protein
MSADVMKMPDPIIEPATIVVASRSPSRRGRVRGYAGCVEPDFVIVPIDPPWLGAILTTWREKGPPEGGPFRESEIRERQDAIGELSIRMP